jgi:hypothetical protein
VGACGGSYGMRAAVCDSIVKEQRLVLAHFIKLKTEALKAEPVGKS